MSAEFARFWSLVDIRSNPRECWEWTGNTDGCGYGIPDAGIQVAFRQPLAHRVACALMRPQPEDAGDVLHSCDNARCCNPRHLRWGTPTENRDDQRIAIWARLATADVAAGRPISDVDQRGNPFTVVDADPRAPVHLRRGLARLSDEIVREIRSDFDSGMSSREIAAKYGLTQSHADSVAKRRIWKRVA